MVDQNQILIIDDGLIKGKVKKPKKKKKKKNKKRLRIKNPLKNVSIKNPLKNLSIKKPAFIKRKLDIKGIERIQLKPETKEKIPINRLKGLESKINKLNKIVDLMELKNSELHLIKQTISELEDSIVTSKKLWKKKTETIGSLFNNKKIDREVGKIAKEIDNLDTGISDVTKKIKKQRKKYRKEHKKLLKSVSKYNKSKKIIESVISKYQKVESKVSKKLDILPNIPKLNHKRSKLQESNVPMNTKTRSLKTHRKNLISNFEQETGKNAIWQKNYTKNFKEWLKDKEYDTNWTEQDPIE